jgi:formyl-CoA transferase/CoA:oxalate CoA-transferase
MTQTQSDLPLAGIRVVDLSRVLAGPYCGMLLAMLGAEVIKVEEGRGDESRQWPPIAKAMGSSYLSINLNKRGMVIDLKQADGQQIVRDLIKTADVVLENFKNGTMEKFGLGYEELRRVNPRLVYTAISAFGRKGPRADNLGYEALVQAYSGVMDATGFPDGLPVRCGVSFLDMSTGAMATLATVSALLRRERTGQGGRVDASLLQTSLGLQSLQVSNFLQHGVVPRRMGTAHAQLVPYQAYPTADGHIFIASGNQNLWEKLCRALKLEPLIADPRFLDNFKRVENREPLLKYLHDAIAGWKTADLMAHLAKSGVPATQVNDMRQLMEDGHVDHIDALADLDDPEFGRLRVSGLPFHIDGHGGAVERRAPKLGEHTQAILEQLGYSSRKIAALMEKGVVNHA